MMVMMMMVMVMVMMMVTMVMMMMMVISPLYVPKSMPSFVTNPTNVCAPPPPPGHTHLAAEVDEVVFPYPDFSDGAAVQDTHSGSTARRLLADPREEGEVQGHARGAGGSFLHGIDLSRHFSYYAYEGGSGQWRWNHEVRWS